MFGPVFGALLQTLGEFGSPLRAPVIDRCPWDDAEIPRCGGPRARPAALDADGNLAAGSVGTTSIREGAVTTSKLTVTDTMAAK
ncbi:hypothetical protein, partial [Schaalia sp.]|uniref:hypothetical protein n=1 Tax=Schaalia sp. TaxID=2691890 RepID=UPI003D14A733